MLYLHPWGFFTSVSFWRVTMPARSIGTATISFGSVRSRGSLFTGESAASVSFNMLHKDCGTKLKQQYICPKHEVVVDRENTVKGREFAKGAIRHLHPEELKALDEKATNPIDVIQFLPLASVDRLYLDKAYYLGPGKGGDKAYRLLTEALKKTGRAGLGQYAARGRQHLVLLRPRDGVLVMEQLYYADELRSPKKCRWAREKSNWPSSIWRCRSSSRGHRRVPAGGVP